MLQAALFKINYVNANSRTQKRLFIHGELTSSCGHNGRRPALADDTDTRHCDS